MRLIFAGTPDFAVPILEAVARTHDVAVVLTQPDRPRGRSRRPEPLPVKKDAQRLGIDVLQPEDLRDPDVLEGLRSLDAAAVVVAAYGRILPVELLQLTPEGCINVHPSLLPAYRGAAPIQRAVLNGDSTTGVSIMKLDEGTDTGPVYAQAEVPIGSDDTAGELAEHLAKDATRLLLGVLDEIERGTATPTPQPDKGASVAAKIDKRDARIDWRQTARGIHNLVRALNPAPGAFTTIGGRRVKVWRTMLEPDGEVSRPGVILQTDPHLKVGTGGGDVMLLEVQPENKDRMSAMEFVRGYRPKIGDTVGSA